MSNVEKQSAKLYTVYVEYYDHGRQLSLEHTVVAENPRFAYYEAIKKEERLLKRRINTTTFERCRNKRIISERYGSIC